VLALLSSAARFSGMATAVLKFDDLDKAVLDHKAELSPERNRFFQVPDY
jgi:hypothetical protein